MLVLTRKIGEKVNIGQDITVEVVRKASGHLSLGIVAPQHVRIVRAELDGRPDSDQDEQPQHKAA